MMARSEDADLLREEFAPQTGTTSVPWAGDAASNLKNEGSVVIDPSAALWGSDNDYSPDERKAWRGSAAKAFSLIAIGLCTGLVLCRVTLDVAAPALEKDLGIDHAFIGVLLGLGKGGYAAGKVGAGMTVDCFRTTHVFVFALTVVGILAAFVGSGINAASLLVSWPLLKACQTFLYPCAVKIICRWFPSNNWSVMIAAGSTIMTIGSTFSNLFLGAMLSAGLSWRALFFTASTLTLMAAVLNALLLRNSPSCAGVTRPPCTDIKTGKKKAKVSHHMDTMSMRGVMSSCARSPRFWAMAGMTVTLHTLNEVQSYLTLFLTGEKELAQGTAASVACVWHIGLATSSMVFGSVFDHLRPGQKFGLVMLLCLMMVGGFGALSFAKDMPLPAVMAMMVCAAAAVGPFYGILPNIFSMDFGGSESCGTVGALLSGMGSLCAMVFNFAAGSIANTYGWPAFMQLLSSTAMVGTVFAAAYMYFSYFANPEHHDCEVVDDASSRSGESTESTECARLVRTATPSRVSYGAVARRP